MRYHDEQGLLAEFAEERHEAAHVGIVKRAVDFVQHAVRRGLFHVDGKQQGRRGKRVLTARERLDTAHLLAGRADVDFDVGIQDVHGLAVLVEFLDKVHLGFAVQEQLAEHELEVLLDTLERLEVAATGDIVELRDGTVERGAGAVQVVELDFHFFQTLLLVFVVFHHVHVDGAQVLDFTAQVTDFAVGLGLAVFHAFNALGIGEVHRIVVRNAFVQAVEIGLQGVLTAAHFIQFLHLLDHLVANAVQFVAPGIQIPAHDFVTFAGNIPAAFEFTQRTVLGFGLARKLAHVVFGLGHRNDVLLDFVLAGTCRILEILDLLRDAAQAVGILGKFRALVLRGTFQVADFLVLFAVKRLLLAELVVHAGVAVFGLLRRGFGFGEFGIAALGLGGSFDAGLRRRNFALQLLQAAVKAVGDVLLDLDTGVAAADAFRLFTDFFGNGFEHTCIFVHQALQALDIGFLLGDFALDAFQKLGRFGNLVLAAERSATRRPAAHEPARADNGVRGDKAQILAAEFTGQGKRILHRINNKVAAEHRRDKTGNLLVRLHKAVKATDNTRTFDTAGIRLGRTVGKRHQSTAHILAFKRPRNLCGSGIVQYNDGIENIAKGCFHARCIFGIGLDTFREQSTNQIRLVFLEPAARIGALVRNALEHVDSRLQAGVFVLQFLQLLHGLVQLGLFAFQAFLTRSLLFLENLDFAGSLVDTPADIVDSRHGLVLLPGDGLQFGIPFFEVAAEHVRFGVHAFKTSLQGIQPVGRLHAFVRKFAGLTTKVIKPVAHHLERFAFAFQQGVHLVNIAIAAEDRILFFQAGLFGFQIGNLVTANLDFAASLLVHAFQGRDRVAQAHNVVVQVVERDSRVLHLAFQIAEGVFVFANGEFLLVNLRL